MNSNHHIVADLDGLQAKVNALRELQSATGKELDALLSSVLDGVGQQAAEVEI